MVLAPLSATGRKEISTDGDGSILDLSDAIEEFLASYESWNGILVVFVPGSTAGITTIEYESGALEDLRRAIETVAPRGSDYAHDRRWGDGNGFSHVRASILGPGLVVPVWSRQLVLGQWQQPILVECDNRPRKRTVYVTVVGQ